MCRRKRRGRLAPSLPDLTAAPAADDVQLRQVVFEVHGEVRDAHQGIREGLKVGRRPAAKALERPGSLTSAMFAWASACVIGQRRKAT